MVCKCATANYIIQSRINLSGYMAYRLVNYTISKGQTLPATLYLWWTQLNDRCGLQASCKQLNVFFPSLWSNIWMLYLTSKFWQICFAWVLEMYPPAMQLHLGLHRICQTHRYDFFFFKVWLNTTLSFLLPIPQPWSANTSINLSPLL